MRQSLITTSNTNNTLILKQQEGFSLLIVLAILIVISLIVVGGAQFVNTDLRISANDGDRKVAFTLAESTLQGAEGQLLNMEAALNIPDTTVQQLIIDGVFTPTCVGTAAAPWSRGLCTASGTYTPVDAAAVNIPANAANAIPAWERPGVWAPAPGVGGPNSIPFTLANNVSTNPPRYIIEILDKDANGTRNYRITARAWGRNTNTVVTLQSYVSVGE